MRQGHGEKGVVAEGKVMKKAFFHAKKEEKIHLNPETWEEGGEERMEQEQ